VEIKRAIAPIKTQINALFPEDKFFIADSFQDKFETIKARLENEPEKGKRCLKCFEFNLRISAKKAKEIGADFFTTTLSVSKYKSSSDLFKIGKEIEKETGVKFLDIDFKKDAGYEKSISLSKEFNIYRQNYCGCEFSK
jgi:predicted adenine nucleotide alpha hydrolase (AANH) superfamily ATPase